MVPAREGPSLGVGDGMAVCLVINKKTSYCLEALAARALKPVENHSISAWL